MTVTNRVHEVISILAKYGTVAIPLLRDCSHNRHSLPGVIVRRPIRRGDWKQRLACLRPIDTDDFLEAGQESSLANG